ncbi:MAG: hypothetical protein LUF04_16205 [Bacteroides sp.]|nr:hypothetical protein [Bacteroides sp.]
MAKKNDNAAAQADTPQVKDPEVPKQGTDPAPSEEPAAPEAEKAPESPAVPEAPIQSADPAEPEAPAPQSTTYAQDPAELKDRQEQTAHGEEAKKAADLAGAMAAVAEPESPEAKLRADGLAILEHNPDAPAVYMTANGFGFFRLNDAENYASTLKDKTVLTVTRE